MLHLIGLGSAAGRKGWQVQILPLRPRTTVLRQGGLPELRNRNK